MLNVAMAIQGSESSSIAANLSDSNVVKVTDSQTLSANGASPGTELQFRSKKATPLERKEAAERFKRMYQLERNSKLDK